MSSRNEKTVVPVTIAGEEYSDPCDGEPEYTTSCAEYVDQMVREIQSQAPRMELHKIAILAAMALTDQLFQARESGEAMRSEGIAIASHLVSQIESALAVTDLAARS